tara:strand:+ start:560 stop:1552 length:993 start_codon:yes stop_codon:yes gene_type:complete
MPRKIGRKKTVGRVKHKNKKMTRRRTHTKNTRKKLKKTRKKMKRIQGGGSGSSSNMGISRRTTMDAERAIAHDKPPLLREFLNLEQGSKFLEDALAQEVGAEWEYDGPFVNRMIEARRIAENYKITGNKSADKKQWKKLLRRADTKIKNHLMGELTLGIADARAGEADRLAAAINMANECLYQEEEEFKALVDMAYKVNNEIARKGGQAEKDALIKLIMEKKSEDFSGTEKENDAKRWRETTGIDKLSETALRREAAKLGIEPYAGIEEQKKVEEDERQERMERMERVKQEEQGAQEEQEAQEAQEAQGAQEKSRPIERDTQSENPILII